MTPRRIIFFLSASILMLAVACKRGGKSGLLVPKDAAVVIHINSGSLSSKLSWSEISQTQWFAQASKEATDSLASKILKDPEASGVDVKGDLVLYMKKQGRGGLMAFEGNIKDAAAFEATNKKMNDGATAVKDGDFNHMELENGGVLTWNKSKFVYLLNFPMPDMSGGFTKSSSYDRYEFPMDSMKLFSKNALNLKADDNLDSDKRFAELVKDGKDVHFWMNSEKLYGNSFGGMLSMMKFNALLEGNIGTGSLNFEDGKIVMTGKQYYGKEMEKMISQYKAKPVSAEVYNRLPSENLVGVLAYNYPPDGIKEFLKVVGLDGMVNGYLGRIGYSVDEFVKAYKGELVVAVSDFNIKTEQRTIDIPGGQPYTYSTESPDVKILVGASVKDRAAFDKLITVASEQLKDMPKDKFPGVSYKLDNNWFVIGNSPENVDKFLAGGNSKNAVADKLGGHPIGIYVDIQKILRAAEASVKDSSGKAGIAASYNMWQDVIGTGGGFEGNSATFTFEINLVDKKTNSLKQINSYFDTLYKVNKEKEDRYRDMNAVDSPAFVPPVIVDTAISR